MGSLCGVDVGTSGTKAVIVDPAGRIQGRALREYPLHWPRPGWAEQEAADWWRATCEAIRAALADAGLSGRDIDAVGLSGQMHGSVILDRHGEVIRPPILWCDVRTADACRKLTEAVGGRERLIELTGNPALEGFTAPKLVWIREHEPAHFERIAHVLLPKDYVRYRMTGEIATEVSDAAGTLLFDVGARRWSAPVAAAVGLPLEALPPVLESSEVAGRLTAEAAEATGLLPNTPVVAGGADNTCGAVGAGIVQPGRLLSSIGSSGVVLAQTERMVKDPQGRVHTFNHSVPHRWYLMGVTLAAGLSLRWWRDQFGAIEREVERRTGIDAYELLGRTAAQSPPGSRGVFFLPYLNGERTPHADANARGVFFGLSTAHTRADVVRAIFEGVAFGLRDCVEIFRQMGQDVEELRAIGGGAKSPLWRQIQADLFQTEVLTLAIDEGPAFGAALLAGVGIGRYGSVAEAAEATVRIGGRTEPHEAHRALYDERYALYRSLYPALRDRFAAAAALDGETAGGKE
ncbi:MAG TPA: xylulokinase [Limnochordia bacterium]